jgi:hypothetical protein
MRDIFVRVGRLPLLDQEEEGRIPRKAKAAYGLCIGYGKVNLKRE